VGVVSGKAPHGPSASGHMRHIVRFSLISLAALFADASVLARTSARGAIRAADLRSGSFAKPASARSIPNFRDSPGDQAATETTANRNKALPLTPSHALGNKIMATVQGLVDDNPVMHGTCSNFAEGHSQSRTRLSIVQRGTFPRGRLRATFASRNSVHSIR